MDDRIGILMALFTSARRARRRDAEVRVFGFRHARLSKTGVATVPYLGVMRCETKTALVLRVGLLPWQTANVAAFLAGGLAGVFPEIVGEPYADASDRLFATTLVGNGERALWTTASGF